MNFLKRIFSALGRRTWYILNFWKFKRLGKKSFIKRSLAISGYKNISIANSVYIGYRVWLAAIPETGSETCRIEIGEGSNIGNFNHIYSTKSIIIGKFVLTADKVYISDNLHNYIDVSTPISKQTIKQIAPVVIGDGSWLGENVCVIGANIGKNVVVGANSVVTKDIPDFCVAVGAPAKIIKRYCFITNEWKKTDKNGNFI